MPVRPKWRVIVALSATLAEFSGVGAGRVGWGGLAGGEGEGAKGRALP